MLEFVVVVGQVSKQATYYLAGFLIMRILANCNSGMEALGMYHNPNLGLAHFSYFILINKVNV